MLSRVKSKFWINLSQRRDKLYYLQRGNDYWVRTSDWMTILHRMPLASEMPVKLLRNRAENTLRSVLCILQTPRSLVGNSLSRRERLVPSLISVLTIELCFSCFIFALTIAIRMWHFSSVTHSLSCPCYILVLISNLIPQYCSTLNGLVTHLLFKE